MDRDPALPVTVQGAASAADPASAGGAGGAGGTDRPAPAPARSATPVRVFVLSQGVATLQHVTRMLAHHPEIEIIPLHEQDDLHARIAQQAPAALLLDASVSQPRALQALRLLRKIKEAALLPILLLCQKVDADFRTTVFSLGAHDYLTFGSDASELLARLRYHVRRSQEQREVRRNARGLAVPTRNVIKVLMVDESKVACQVVAQGLASHPDILVSVCTQPERVLAMADEFLPTVLLQSLVMRSCDAFALLASLRQNLSTRDVPIIVLSGTADPVQKARALAAGADDYVVKSSDLEELLTRMRFHADGYFNLQKGRLAPSTANASSEEDARVLMVDDSKFFCSAIAQLLASEPHIRFAACVDPTVAIDLAKAFRPTVILQDLEMPQLDGLELLQRFRENPSTREIPIIVLSGITSPATKAKAFAEGANDYVEKQMDKIELVSRIRYHSRSYRNAVGLGDSIRKLLETQKRLEIQGEFIRKTFGRYLSDEVVSSLLASPEGLKLGGEKRRISILMTDLRGFTSLAERLPPEEVLAIINNYLRVMTDILLSYGATIDEFIGDAILAMFGAPRVHEDDAQRAVACAVEMQLAMQGVNEVNRQAGYPEVRMGIGIHTGEVVVGNIGSEKRAKYGVVGKTVNLTSRIESLTLGGQILISESTHDACGDLLRIDSSTEVMLKGVRQPVRVFEVGGIGGRYQRFLPARIAPTLIALTVPIAVRYSILEGKQAGEAEHAGRLVALSPEAARLVTEVSLESLSNLKLTLIDSQGHEVCSEVYCKVSAQPAPADAGVRVDFTSLPPEATAFLGTLQIGGSAR